MAMQAEREGTVEVRKILFADDERDILELLEVTLEDDENYQVLLARDGEQALALCEREHPDVVFLDIRMPKLDGVSVCARLRQDPRFANTKVVMLTGLARESEIDRAMAAGADDYMTKPFSPTALYQKLLEALGLANAEA